MRGKIAIAVLALLNVGQAAATRDPGTYNKPVLTGQAIAESPVIDGHELDFESLPIGLKAPFFLAGTGDEVGVNVFGGDAAKSPIIASCEGVKGTQLLVPGSVQLRFGEPIDALRLNVDCPACSGEPMDVTVTLLDEQGGMTDSKTIMSQTDEDGDEHLVVESSQPFTSAIFTAQALSWDVFSIEYAVSSEDKF